MKLRSYMTVETTLVMIVVMSVFCIIAANLFSLNEKVIERSSATEESVLYTEEDRENPDDVIRKLGLADGFFE